jgi:hypothetical protein
LEEGGIFRELAQFQEHYQEYRIVVFTGINCEDILLDGHGESIKRIDLIFIVTPCNLFHNVKNQQMHIYFT